MRRIVQLVAAVAQNGYLAFPWAGPLYQGALKRVCTPGLNCYSCPAALFACPLGALQHFLAGVRPALSWGTYRLGFYVVGFLMAVGLVGGRMPCGWLCPFGLLQDGLHRIRSPKLPVPRALGGVRYGVLAVLVVGLPLAATGAMGYGEAWFCRLLCPAGTLEAGGLFFLMPELRAQLGAVFAVKAALLGAVVGWAVVSYRPYCRTLCPLGALYGLFNRWSLVGVRHDPARCTGCGTCLGGCRVGLNPRRAGRSPACLRCFECAGRRCPAGALTVGSGRPAPGGVPCDPPSIPAS
ncbi:MAG: 4Fe-4S binding protein [Deferrisomatales bacterium]